MLHALPPVLCLDHAQSMFLFMCLCRDIDGRRIKKIFTIVQKQWDFDVIVSRNEIVHVPTVASLVQHPGKAKRESCKKKAHNDGHVPHHRHEATPVVENNSLHSLKPSEAQKCQVGQSH